MTLPLAVGALVAVALVMAALRQRFSARKDSAPLGLGVRQLDSSDRQVRR